MNRRDGVFFHKVQEAMAIEKALADLDALATALDRFVADEEARTRIADVRNCQYSTAARAARTRSDNLKKTFAKLKAKLDALPATSMAVAGPRASPTSQDANLRLPTTTPDNQRMSGYRFAVS